MSYGSLPSRSASQNGVQEQLPELHQAAEKGDLNRVKALVNKRHNLSDRNYYSQRGCSQRPRQRGPPPDNLQRRRGHRDSSRVYPSAFCIAAQSS